MQQKMKFGVINSFNGAEGHGKIVLSLDKPTKKSVFFRLHNLQAVIGTKNGPRFTTAWPVSCSSSIIGQKVVYCSERLKIENIRGCIYRTEAVVWGWLKEWEKVEQCAVTIRDLIALRKGHIFPQIIRADRGVKELIQQLTEQIRKESGTIAFNVSNEIYFSSQAPERTLSEDSIKLLEQMMQAHNKILSSKPHLLRQ